MKIQEIRIIATGPCITNQLRDVNTICRRSWYIAEHIWKIYDFKIEVVSFIINFSTKGQTTIYKDRVTWIPKITGDELRCSWRVSISCSTSGTRRVNLVTNLLISHEWGKDREVFTTSGTYLWSFVTQTFHNGQPSHGGDHKTFEVLTST